MTYKRIQFFMENLKQLSYCNDNPLINSHPLLLYERPQFQLIYEELSSLIQILFVDRENDLHELRQVRNLKRRIKDVAEEAHNIVALFVYAVNFKIRRHALIGYYIKYFNEYFLKLEYTKRSINFIKKDLNAIIHNLKMDSSPDINPRSTKDSATGTSFNKNQLRATKVLGKTVGLNPKVKLIRDQLTLDQKQLDVVSIIGMGGLGKTTLANLVFNDRFVLYHFHIRAWVTVPQLYEKRDLLIQILADMDVQLEFEKATYSKLREVLHKSLMGKRYLIVVDDIWSNEVWDDLKVFFPNDNTGSRILLTSRLKEVAFHAKLNGFVHHLEYLTDEESWKLLRKKVFHANDCPEWLIEPGMEIAKNCHGLPLAVVVIAGVLVKEAALRKDVWEKIAQHVSSYIVSHQNGYVDILAMSYDHLPPHLKNCFLYLGGFPENYKFRVKSLIWLWMAEGFIHEDENQSLEETGEDYLNELVDRNLVLVVDRKFDGAIKACSVHDLLRELSMDKARKENFFQKIHWPTIYLSSIRPRRKFIYVDSFDNMLYQPSPMVHSLLFTRSDRSKIDIPDRYFYSYPLLMVLDLQKCQLSFFPEAIQLLVHLRYLAFWYTKGFPSSICNLWRLQTLIAKSSVQLELPDTISNLENLRHLWSDGISTSLLLKNQ